MVHQVLREGAQEPKALVGDTLRPEDNPLQENQRCSVPVRSPDSQQALVLERESSNMSAAK